MERRVCKCGCGMVIPNPTNRQVYLNASHRRRDYYTRNKGSVEKRKRNEKSFSLLTPYERWERMTLSEERREELRLHKSYGEIQTMYYNRTLPDDFGLEIR